jgi:hypothetical protein
MARTSRSGTVADTSTSVATGRDYREQVKLAKARKKHEKEQALQMRNGTNERVSRAKSTQIDALYREVPMKATLPSHTPSPQSTRRRTRQEKPSCTDYGPLRHALYNRPPKYLFCAECDAWDRDKNIVAKIQQSSRRYKCIAGHGSCIFPTTELPGKGRRRERGKTLVKAIRRSFIF